MINIQEDGWWDGIMSQDDRYYDNLIYRGQFPRQLSCWCQCSRLFCYKLALSWWWSTTRHPRTHSLIIQNNNNPVTDVCQIKLLLCCHSPFCWETCQSASQLYPSIDPHRKWPGTVSSQRTCWAKQTKPKMHNAHHIPCCVITSELVIQDYQRM